MSEHQIIFSGPMVCAILEGRKTMTRRPIKPQPYGIYRQSGAVLRLCATGYEDSHGCCVHGRGFYRYGDRLWVRETWAPCDCGRCGGYVYRADGEPPATGGGVFKWRSPIYMPRRASRITLEITRDSWPQKVQSISDDDSIREGLSPTVESGAWETMTVKGDYIRCVSPTDAYAALWDSIYAKKPEYQWAKNPWVWVHEFRRVTP